MGVPTLGAQGGYATPAGICVQASQTTIIAEINKLYEMIDVEDGTRAASPDFDMIPPHARAKLLVELTAITTAIDAMAIA